MEYSPTNLILPEFRHQHYIAKTLCSWAFTELPIFSTPKRSGSCTNRDLVNDHKWNTRTKEQKMRRQFQKFVSGVLLLSIAALGGVQITHAQPSVEPAPALSVVTLDVTGMT